MAVFVLFQMNLPLNLSLLLLVVVVGISCTPHGIRKESPSFSQVNYLAFSCPSVGFILPVNKIAMEFYELAT
jgi:hypothetical protein